VSDHARIQWERNIGESERGAGLVEYALVVTLIAIACLVAVRFLGDETSKSFTETGESVSIAS
jgi:pilus assembly protein Flp/PilA